MAKILCMDAGGTFVKWAVMDENENILDRGKYETELDDREKFLDDVEAVYRAHSDVEGLAFSMPGVIDVEKEYMHNAGRILCLVDTPFCAMVRERCDGKPVSIENDGKAAARAEMVSGALKDCRNGVVLVLGTAIAGTIFLDRKIIRGSHLFAGEISYNYRDNTVVNPDRETHWYAREMIGQGFWTIVTPAGIAEAYNALSGEQLGAKDCEEIFTRMKNGDENASKAIHQAAKDLAMLIFNIQTVVDPDAFAIGGGISAQDAYIELVQKYVRIYKPVEKPVCPIPEVRVCQYRGDANLYGALYAFREKFA